MSFSWDIRNKCLLGIAAGFDYMAVWAEPNSDEMRYNAYSAADVSAAVLALGRKALEVYDLRMPLDPQIAARRAWNMPTSTSSEQCLFEPVELPVEPSI